MQTVFPVAKKHLSSVFFLSHCRFSPSIRTVSFGIYLEFNPPVTNLGGYHLLMDCCSSLPTVLSADIFVFLYFGLHNAVTATLLVRSCDFFAHWILTSHSEIQNLYFELQGLSWLALKSRGTPIPAVLSVLTSHYFFSLFSISQTGLLPLSRMYCGFFSFRGWIFFLQI